MIPFCSAGWYDNVPANVRRSSVNDTMSFNAIGIPARLKRILALILIAGFGAAIVIYAMAAPGSANPTGFDPEDSKRDLRDIEVYGGKANLLASDFRHTFSSLWHGRRLAFTVAFLTIMLAAAVLFFGAPLPPVEAPSTGRPSGPRGTSA